jgi:hypothetical protein
VQVLQLMEGYRPTKETLNLVSPDVALIALVAGYTAATMHTVGFTLRDAMPATKVAPGHSASEVAGDILFAARAPVWSLLYDLGTCLLMLAALLVKVKYSYKALELGSVQRWVPLRASACT